jgi:NTE family protein
VSVAKEMGADIVIAVDVSMVKRNAEITSIYDVIMQSIDIMQTEIINKREVAADIMLRPPVEIYSSRAFTNIEELILLGEEEAKKHLDQIKKVIEQWKG